MEMDERRARFAERREWDLALAEWSRLKDLWPDDSQLHLACADVFFRYDRWTEAAAGYGAVAELSDDRGTLSNNRAALLGRARARARDVF